MVFLFKASERLPAVLRVKSQLLQWFIFHLDSLPVLRAKNIEHEMIVLKLVDEKMGVLYSSLSSFAYIQTVPKEKGGKNEI